MSVDRKRYSIPRLYADCTRAYKQKDWQSLGEISREFLTILRVDAKSHPDELTMVSRYYLASIMRNGKFLLKSNLEDLRFFEVGLNNLKIFLQNSSEDLRSILKPQIRAVHEIRLFLTNPNADSQNKAASSLRKIARPDLAIELTSEQLSRTRLNYYSLTVRGWAFLDLGEIEQAISDGELALKHSPKDKIARAHALLGSAYRKDFRKNGDLDVGERAVKHASEAYDLEENFFNARILLAAYDAIGQQIPNELSNKLNAYKLPNEHAPSLDALEIASNVILQSLEDLSAPTEDEDSDFDLDEWLGDRDGSEESDVPSDYFEDYFEDYAESLNDPQQPHLEP